MFSYKLYNGRFGATPVFHAYFSYIKGDFGGSVGCAVQLETRRSRVQPLPRSATCFRGD